MNITDDIARSYGACLTTAETAWLRALQGAGTNLSELASAIEAGKIGISVATDLVSMSKTGIAHLIDAGQAYASLHSRVSALAKLSGLEPIAYGFSYTAEVKAEPAAATLRLVEDAGAAAVA